MRWAPAGIPCFTRAVFLKPGLWSAPWLLALPSSLEPFLALSGTRSPHMAAFLETAPSPVNAGSEKQELRELSDGASVRRARLGKGAVAHTLSTVSQLERRVCSAKLSDHPEGQFSSKCALLESSSAGSLKSHKNIHTYLPGSPTFRNLLQEKSEIL